MGPNDGMGPGGPMPPGFFPVRLSPSSSQYVRYAIMCEIWNWYMCLLCCTGLMVNHRRVAYIRVV